MTVGLKEYIRTVGQSTSLAPDGSELRISAPGFDFGWWDATIRVRLERPYTGLADGKQLRQLHVVPAGNYESVIALEYPGAKTQVVSGAEGEFVIMEGYDDRQGLAFWRGPWHEVATWLIPKVDVGARALQFFARLRFLDSPQGLVIEPTSAPAEKVHLIQSTLLVHEVGFLDVYPAEQNISLVPEWSGSKVPAGEVWAINHHAGESQSYLLATENTVAILNPVWEADQAKQDSKVGAFLEGITSLTRSTAKKA